MTETPTSAEGALPTARLTPGTAETHQSFGPCIECGRGQTRNPHPHAGEPDHPEASYVWHCVPCLVENRHRWARRAQRAESTIGRIEALFEAGVVTFPAIHAILKEYADA